MITGVSFHVEVRFSPDRIDRRDDDTRSIPQLLKEEIQSNLESLPGVFQATVTRVNASRRPR